MSSTALAKCSWDENGMGDCRRAGEVRRRCRRGAAEKQGWCRGGGWGERHALTTKDLVMVAFVPSKAEVCEIAMAYLPCEEGARLVRDEVSAR